MPALKFKAISGEKICAVSKQLVDELEQLLQCPRNYFSLEAVQSTYINDGKYTEGNPVVEVSWFDRGQEIQDKAAEIITRYVRNSGCSDVDVIFIKLDKSSYYENGEHF